MYSAELSGLKSIGRKVIKAADAVADGAARVSGAVKGAGVGAQTAPAHPYILPITIGVGVLILAAFLSRGRR